MTTCSLIKHYQSRIICLLWSKSALFALLHNVTNSSFVIKDKESVLSHFKTFVIKTAPNPNESSNLLQTYSDGGRMVAHHGLSFVTNLTVLKSFFSFFRADLDFLLK